MSKTPIIEMENVGIRYGRGPEILSNINLSLERGSFHYLTGKSGAGKTFKHDVSGAETEPGKRQRVRQQRQFRQPQFAGDVPPPNRGGVSGLPPA